MPFDDTSPALDRREQAQLFEKHSPKLFHYFRKRARNVYEIRDLMQETFARVLRKPVAEIDDPSKWLHGVAYHVLLEHYANTTRHGAPVEEPSVVDLASPLSLTAPEQAANREWVARNIAQALESSRLRPMDRRVFALSDMEGLSNAEIAERCGLTLYQVQRRLKKARARLRDLITRLTDGDMQ